MRPIAAVLLLAAGLAGCGSGSNNVVRAPAPATGSTSPTAAPPSSSTLSTARTGTPSVRVSPATGLHARQKITVSASGFTPGEALTVIECAAKGNATGAGDCYLTGMLAVSADAAGRVATSLNVVRGPFGGNAIVCSAHQPCLISVTQASLSPTEEADTPIAFASSG